MAKYKVRNTYTQLYENIVEADSRKDAQRKFYEQLTRVDNENGCWNDNITVEEVNEDLPF